jgi:hypothetical protein
MLEKQSERCALYIKLSVIVEDALQFLNGIMGDFSPQLVLYGKALEQALRDDFYDLFHTRNDLYDFGNFLFRDSDPASTYIGNYRYAISEKKDRLCIMCQNYNLATDDGSKWESWWQDLQGDIDRARRIRNRTDHSDVDLPDGVVLDHMCQLLFGTGGEKSILDRGLVGRELYAAGLPVAYTPEVIAAYKGSNRNVTSIKKNARGGMRGKTSDGNYKVNIAPSEVKKFFDQEQFRNLQEEGLVLEVQILEYVNANQNEYFTGAIIGIVQ